MDDGDDLAVFVRSDFELLHILRLDGEESKFVMLGHHQPDGPARHFCDVGYSWIEASRGIPGAKRAAVVFVDVSNFRNIHIQASCQGVSHGVDGLSVSPERQPVTVPFGDTAERLYRN